MQTHLDMCQQTFVCGCKGSELFWIEQIFLLKVCSLRVKGKESPNSIRDNGHRKAQSAI
mgnify:CR=1 FL=1